MTFLLLAYPIFLDNSVQVGESPDLIRTTINNQILMMQRPKISNPILGVIITKEEPKSYIGAGYCTDLVKYYRKIPWNGHALYWEQNAVNANYPVGDVPKLNAIMIETSELPYGHVALIIDINEDTFTVLEQNWKGRGIISTRILPLDYSARFIY